jgi:hypothetical protein
MFDDRGCRLFRPSGWSAAPACQRSAASVHLQPILTRRSFFGFIFNTLATHRHAQAAVNRRRIAASSRGRQAHRGIGAPAAWIQPLGNGDFPAVFALPPVERRTADQLRQASTIVALPASGKIPIDPCSVNRLFFIVHRRRPVVASTRLLCHRLRSKRRAKRTQKRRARGRHEAEERNCGPADRNWTRGEADQGNRTETSEFLGSRQGNVGSSSEGLWSCLWITSVFSPEGARLVMSSATVATVTPCFYCAFRGWGEHRRSLCWRKGNPGLRAVHF